ncbi:hypothetical protein [Pseudomonas sp. Leaf59]|uniref:hypothetical protein n=1 Tax=Pseudomonas sp. Leaf59 TaxID=2876556 RepID=UPI001E64B670|nr:hypothetical protein [Pseudomonas sp. Leaf59]
MNVISSTVSQLSFAQQQLAPEAASKPSAAPVSPDNHVTATNAKRAGDAIEYEMFADEGDRFTRPARGRLSRLFKKKTAPAPADIKAPDSIKASGSAVSTSEASGITRFDQDFAKQQAEIKLDDNTVSKLGREDVVIVEPTSVHLAVASANVNGKAVSPFSSDTLKKAKKEFEEATGASDTDTRLKADVEDVDAKSEAIAEPEKKKISDTKKALIVIGVGAVVTPAVAGIVEALKKALADDPAVKFAASLKDTKIIDKTQEEVFAVANMLTKLVGEKEIKADLQWALKSDEQRMTSLESIIIEAEKGFIKLAEKFNVPFALPEYFRIEDPLIESRAKVIESRLAVIIALSEAVTNEIKVKTA